jgi:hypothetical protein
MGGSSASQGVQHFAEIFPLSRFVVSFNTVSGGAAQHPVCSSAVPAECSVGQQADGRSAVALDGEEPQLGCSVIPRVSRVIATKARRFASFITLPPWASAVAT